MGTETKSHTSHSFVASELEITLADERKLLRRLECAQLDNDLDAAQAVFNDYCHARGFNSAVLKPSTQWEYQR